MALSVTGLERSFVFQKENTEITLTDPNADMTPDQVMSFFSHTYPELTTSTVHGPEINGDKVVYHFKTTIGTKG